MSYLFSLSILFNLSVAKLSVKLRNLHSEVEECAVQLSLSCRCVVVVIAVIAVVAIVVTYSFSIANGNTKNLLANRTANRKPIEAACRD